MPNYHLSSSCIKKTIITRYAYVLLALLTITISCKEKSTPTDNLFKFKDYISYTTEGRQSVMSPIRVELAQPLTQFEVDQVLPNDIIKVRPKVSGVFSLHNSRLLEFIPEEPLKPDTAYEVTLMLDKLYDDLDTGKEQFTFGFKTITPDFKVAMGALQSYSKDYNYLEGQIEASDDIAFAKAQQLINASQNGNALAVKWFDKDGVSRFHSFRIDSISRTKADSQIRVAWDGKAIGARDTNGKNTIQIPGKDNFKIIGIHQERGANASVIINFSDPLKDNQNFAGLVTIARAGNLRFEVNGNVLQVYPENKIVGNALVEVFQGIKSTDDYKLKQPFKETVSFEQIKPAIRAITNGVILPKSTSTPYYFEAVNLTHVDVRVIKIYEDNVLEFLQEGSLNNTSSYNLKKVGRRIAKKTIEIAKQGDLNTGQWQAHGVDLSAIFKADPGALYRVEISYKPSYAIYECDDAVAGSVEEDSYEDYYEDAYTEAESPDEDDREEQYWDNRIYRWRKQVYDWRQEDNPCHPAYYQESKFVNSNLLGSNLGVIVKKGKDNSYLFATSDIVTTTPEANTKITLYNYQKQPIATVTTDATGIAQVTPDGYPVYAVAVKDGNYAYLKLQDGHSLSMSKFDIAGNQLEKGLKGFTYLDRGVHRPGDTIHLTFTLNDKANPLPKDHPVKLEVTDARGKLMYRKVASGSKGGSQNGNQALNNFYYFPVPTEQDAPTGNYNATISVGGATFNKTLKVETIKPNRLKVDLTFKDEILQASGNLSGGATVKWLHGAPARNLKIKTDVTIRKSSSGFSKFPGYNFYDPIREFDEVSMDVLDGTLDNEGNIKINKKIDLSKRAPGMLKATFVTKAYEGGGDFSLDVVSKDVAPFDHFVGLRAPKSRAYGSYYTDQNIEFDLATTNAQGTPAAGRKLQVKVFKMSWRWWWNRSRDNYSSYETSTVHTPVQNFTVTSGSNGKTSFNINIPEKESGRYLIRVIDPESGHATGRIAYFYRNWGGFQRDSESAKMLVFSADKDEYSVGDNATITFPSSAGGRALVSIENGTKVLESYWVETQQGKTNFSLPVTSAMAPNVYVNISLLQPHKQSVNDLPIRLYGVIPLMVKDRQTVLEPVITMPDVLKPEEPYTIKITEKNNKQMTYTIAVVDDGLLDLTRFQTPKIHKHFYSREALGVKSFDMYDYVIGAYSGSVDNIYAIGGGDAASAAKNRKAERFKPVVTYLGPFALSENETKSHTVTMPNYVGSVRAMVIAGDATKSAYGSVEKTVPVRKPLMVLGSLPRKLSPGEHVTLPVTVFAMEKNIKQAKITVKTSEAFKASEGNVKTVNFTQVGEKIVPFEFDVQAATGVQTVQIIVEGHGERATYDVEIDVENPNPITQKVTDYELDPSSNLTIDYETFGVAGTNESALEFSTLPPMDFTKRMQYLIRYPHGCVEQTTSGVFPQLFLDDVFDLTYEQKRDAQQYIKDGIARLGRFQNTDGGLGYWQGEIEADLWGTTYAGHFMIEAQKKGYALPLTFMNNWLRFQKKEAREWRSGQQSYNATLVQAYRLYTLALAGQPDLAAMNRLRENTNLSNEATWRLAGAYALAGQDKVAGQLTATANIDFTPKKYDYHTYGSVYRNRAMALETMVLLNDSKQKELAVSIAKTLASDRWLSTQETSYALLAMAKMVVKNGGKAMQFSYTKDGKEYSVDTQQAIALRDIKTQDGANEIIIKNAKNSTVFIRLVQSGKLPLGKELVDQKNLQVKTTFYNLAGEVMSINNLQQGEEFTAKITVSNTSRDYVDNVALTQIFPSGWEIVNTRFTDAQGGTAGSARYTDIRDDRVQFYFDMSKTSTRTFTVRLNASYLGDYYLPGTQVEAMYDATYYARSKGAWIKVKN
ncbi:MG2 domain-containing protein [Dokdonia sp. PRO95]|uniref:alpha-2-macroglobulin family protein n=1 Tax=Dokdonia sp. PRO95 TaxID=1239415 RepID=UPI0009DCA8E4|nr:MG2 domain-containing protein [Dokdonia sp. PRO95]